MSITELIMYRYVNVYIFVGGVTVVHPKWYMDIKVCPMSNVHVNMSDFQNFYNYKVKN